jgi:hypothetical protein
MEQQHRQQLGLVLRPENRKQPRRITPHYSIISSVYAIRRTPDSSDTQDQILRAHRSDYPRVGGGDRLTKHVDMDTTAAGPNQACAAVPPLNQDRTEVALLVVNG